MHLPDLSLPITDPVLIFALVMVIILVLPLLFERMRVPGIVGLIIAGVIIGPHALHVLARDQTMELLGTVGLLYIMFIAGLEVDLNEFSRQRNRSILFGILTFGLPQGAGTLVARYGLGFDWPASVLLGAVFASHTLVAYPIISRLGLSKGEAVTTAVGATILTDTAALLVLAVIVRSTEGALTFMFWVQMAVLLSAFVFGVLWGVPRLGRWFFQKVRSDGVFEFVFVLAVVFVCAFLAVVAGVEPIIGAFLAGLALNRLVPEQSTLMSRTRFVGESLFIPFFLISVGMLVDVRVLVGGVGAWTVAGVMLGTVTVTKWLAAQMTRPLFGYTSDQGWMLFGLTVPQAAATLATVLIGYSVGIFGDDVLNGTIMMMLATCMIGPWIAERYGRRVALRADRAPFRPSHVQQRILVPLANPETAPLLMDIAMMVRQPTSEQPIYPLAIVRNHENVQSGVAAGEKLLGHAILHAAAADVPVTPVVRVDHNVASGILRAIRERMISTVIIGWNGKSSGRHYTFGSILDQLLDETHELMLVSKIEQPLATVSRVVLAVPPHAHLDAGFADVVRTVKVLAGQMSASILVLSSDEGLSGIRKLMGSSAPHVPVVYQQLDAWARLPSTYEDHRKADDLLLLVAARPGTVAWRPALRRLPRLLAQRFPERNFVVCYPPIPFDEAYPSHTLPSGDLVLGELLSKDRVLVDVRGGNADEVLREMLTAALHDRPELITRTQGAFSMMEADYVPELMPGVVLYHAHVPGVRDPMLLVGISGPGINIPRSSSLVHVVLALLSPEEGSAEDHLRSLALVARLVRSADTIDALRAANSPGEARDIMASSFLEPQFGWQRRLGRTRLPTRDHVPGGALYRNVGVVVSAGSDLIPLFTAALHRTLSFGKRVQILYTGLRSDTRAAELKETLAEVGFSLETPVHWLDRRAGEGLIGAAAEHEIDLLILEAFEDAGALAPRLGRTAQALVHPTSPSLLLIAQSPEEPTPYRRIVVVIEHDENSMRVYRKVLRLAARERAEHIFVVRIIPKFGDARILPVVKGHDEAHSRRSLEEREMLEMFVDAGGSGDIPVQTFCLEGQFGTAATQFAHRYKADLLVISSVNQYPEIADRLYPSETKWGIREAPCDIWIESWRSERQ